MANPAFWRGRRVLVTGHTGLKGAWLTVLLLELGAEVTGFGRGEPTQPSLFGALALGPRIRSLSGDVRDRDAVREAITGADPQAVIHMAAQAIVRRSHE